MTKIRQFNWRRHWKKKVEPHLTKDVVQGCLDLGMTLLDPTWKHGDAPYLFGSDLYGRVVEGKLSWYRPVGRCHWISFFAMAIGVINYPDLTWRMVSGDFHTVPVGYGPDAEPRIVMDILLFDHKTAEECIALTQKRSDSDTNRTWDRHFRMFEEMVVPVILETCVEGKKPDGCGPENFFSSTEER